MLLHDKNVCKNFSDYFSSRIQLTVAEEGCGDPRIVLLDLEAAREDDLTEMPQLSQMVLKNVVVAFDERLVKKESLTALWVRLSFIN